MSLTGIDVSSYQGTINWWAVKQNGIDFAILKVIRKDLNPDKKFEENNLFGVAGTLWSECITSPERIYYQAYPRSIALAEAGWSQQQNRSWKSFIKRMRPLAKDMMRRGVTFSMEY